MKDAVATVNPHASEYVGRDEYRMDICHAARDAHIAIY